MPNKLPAMLFYTGDWLKDPAVTLCSPATRGIWIDLLCAMHEARRVGELRGTIEQLARVARCQPSELAAALTELQVTQAADVAERNGTFIVSNRRMKRDSKSRLVGALRQQRFRRNGESHTPVTPIEDGCANEIPPERRESPRERFTEKQKRTILGTTAVAVELPYGFPETADEAIKQSFALACDPEFIEKVWNKAHGRGGRDSHDIPIRVFLSYLKTEWKYEVERRHKEKMGYGKSKERSNPEGNQRQETIEIPRL